MSLSASGIEMMTVFVIVSYADVFAWVTGFGVVLGFGLVFIRTIDSINAARG